MPARPNPIHFIFSGSQHAVGGGLTAWKSLLGEPPEDVVLHYSSFAEPLWNTFHPPHVRHYAHQGWRTWENRNYARYDRSYLAFDFARIQPGSRVVMDSMEGLRQLGSELRRRSCSIFLHVQSPFGIIRGTPATMIMDLRRLRMLRKAIYISNFVKRKLHGSGLGKVLLAGVDQAVIYSGIEGTDQIIEGRDKRCAFYFRRYDGYKNPQFLRSLEVPSKYIGTSRGCASPVEIPPDLDLGWMAPREAAAQGDIFIFPSTNEAFGLAVLEMMSYGKIVIAFRSGAFPEFIDHGRNGFLIRPFDVHAANTIINDVRSDPTRARSIRTAASRTVKERFSADSYRGAFFRELSAELP